MHKVFIAWLVGLWSGAGNAPSMAVPPTRQMVVIVCDGVTLPALERMSEPVPTLLRRSTLGLLSGSSLQWGGRKSVYVTLGSGVRQPATAQAALGRWLTSNGARITTIGDGLLAALLGTPLLPAPPRPTVSVTFVSATPKTLSLTLRQWLKKLPKGGCLWLIIPNSPQTGWTTRSLTPILLFGAGVPTGWLTSPTTRTIGLVSSVDFAPTLLRQLRFPIPPQVTGAPMRVVPMADPLPHLHWLHDRSQLPLRQLPSVILVGGGVVVVALLLTLCALLSPSVHWRRWQQTVVIAGMSLPAALFFIGQIPADGWACFALLLAAIGLIALIATLSPAASLPDLRFVGIVCGLSAAVALLGVPLYWATPLGHYPTIGWRYFGITNAGIGIVLAGTIFSWQFLSLPRHLVAAWCLLAPLLMGTSLWGANFGGALTLAVGFAAAWELVAQGEGRGDKRTKCPAWQRVLWRAVLATVVTVSVLSLTESWLPADGRAHYGQLLLRLKTAGPQVLTEMVGRKLRLFWVFTTALPLNFALLSTFAAFTVALPPLLRRHDALAALRPTFVATFLGGWCGFCLNDSGVEVIGMVLVYVGGVFLLLVPVLFPSPILSSPSRFSPH